MVIHESGPQGRIEGGVTRISPEVPRFAFVEEVTGTVMHQADAALTHVREACQL